VILVTLFAWFNAGHHDGNQESPMSNKNPPFGEAFDQLIDAMPRIVAAVNSFTSESTQRVALDALLRTAGLPDGSRAALDGAAGPGLTVVPPLEEDDAAEEGARGDVTASAGDKQAGARQRRAPKPAGKSWRPRDIDFRSAQGASLREFAEEKEPRNFYEKNVVIVFFLEESLGTSPIDPGHLLAGYQHCGWKAPKDPENSLCKTKHAKGWLDTSDVNNVRLTHAGRQFVLYDLPTKKSKPA
jgi:hypothetical protein